MEGQTALEHIDAEVRRLADEAMPELLPRLLKIFLADDRPGLVTCERHMQRLIPYVAAQISLTRAKRNYYRDDMPLNWSSPCSDSPRETREYLLQRAYDNAILRRDQLRVAYRSTPCTCWVKHR